MENAGAICGTVFPVGEFVSTAPPDSNRIGFAIGGTMSG